MSDITIINDTNEAIKVGVFREPFQQPTLHDFAWVVVEPPPEGGRTVVAISASYDVYVNYSFDHNERDDPYGGSKTNTLAFSETTANFEVDTVTSDDQRASAATLKQVFENLVVNEVRIKNNFGTGVWTHLTQGGKDILRPEILPPGMTYMADVAALTFNLAIVSGDVDSGQSVMEEEVVSGPTTPILEGQTATITGSKYDGYAITIS